MFCGRLIHSVLPKYVVFNGLVLGLRIPVMLTNQSSNVTN